MVRFQLKKNIPLGGWSLTGLEALAVRSVLGRGSAARGSDQSQVHPLEFFKMLDHPQLLGRNSHVQLRSEPTGESDKLLGQLPQLVGMIGIDPRSDVGVRVLGSGQSVEKLESGFDRDDFTVGELGETPELWLAMQAKECSLAPFFTLTHPTLLEVVKNHRPQDATMSAPREAVGENTGLSPELNRPQ